MAYKPYPQPSSHDPNRYSWADAELEPKQQHRFVAYMPVFMPRGIVTDAKELATLIKDSNRNSSANPALVAAAKERAVASEKITSVTDTFMNAAGSPTAPEAISNMVNAVRGVTGLTPREIESIIVPDQDAFKIAFNRAFTSTSRNVLHTRVSPYIVKSFRPPSFGVNIVEAPVPSTAMKAVSGAETTANVGRAQLSFVSTLQDDMHFSLLFLWYMGLEFGSQSGAKSFPLFNETAIDGQIITETQKYLVIEEISADKNPLSGGDRFRDAAVGQSTVPTDGEGHLFAPTIVGLHKLFDPMVSNVEFSEFSYGGTELMEVTIELTYRKTQGDFYSYETYINPRALGGDTRYQNPRGDGYSARPGEDKFSNRFNARLRDGYGNYPRAALPGPGLMGKEPNTPLHKIMANIKTDTRVKYELRRQKIKNAMQSRNPRYINEMVTNNINSAEDMRQADQAAADRAARIGQEDRNRLMSREQHREERRNQDLRGRENREERRRLGA